MPYGNLGLADRIAVLAERVTVTAGGLKAETAGELYEADNPQALARRLGSVLYDTLHSGRAKPLDAKPRSLRNAALDAALDEATGERTTTSVGRLAAEAEDHLVVLLEGLRVRVPHDRVSARSDDGSGGERVTVVVPCARPGLSSGFFLANSSLPAPERRGPLLRLYGHLDTPGAAPEVWRALVDFLEDSGVPWQAKIASSPIVYPRNDALVVYLPRPSWRVARDCASALQATGLLAGGTSPFTRALTPSVGCAFEPDDPRRARQELSFGQHRAQVFAEALVRHATDAGDGSEPLADTVATAFLDAGIDPAEPARNLSSPITDVLRPS
ncbi:T3SS effector HopA1 family protein [Streptomyces sp. NPDC060048]|uniref:T3SS effector HopA1 family protein n=1 Tax=unclassified Streptomyces TaxID=2593676 RepID=UPI003679E2E9